MSKILHTHSRKLLVGGALIGVVAMVQTGTLPNPFYTPGVQNIEERYSAGGGAKNKQTAVATKRSDPNNVTANTETNKGVGTPHHEEKYGEQKPPVSSVGKAWNRAHFGDDKGK